MCVDCESIHSCPACGGECFPLGALGRAMHFRCRQCGMNSMTYADNAQTAYGVMNLEADHDGEY